MYRSAKFALSFRPQTNFRRYDFETKQFLNEAACQKSKMRIGASL